MNTPIVEYRSRLALILLAGLVLTVTCASASDSSYRGAGRCSA